jgi:hypothetical protein
MNRAIVAVALLAVVSVSLDAQWIRYPTAGLPRTADGKPNLAAAAPRLPNGKPDFSGVWQNDGYGAPGGEGTGPTPRTVFFDLTHGMKGVTPPYQPWAADLYKRRKDDQAKDNPDARCLPIGALQMLAHPLPKKILHNPSLLVILHERNMEFRQIFVDGRGLPDDPQPSWYGYSTARWEGDTLVVDTIGFRDGLWAVLRQPADRPRADDGTHPASTLRRARDRGDDRRSEGLHEALDRISQPTPGTRHRTARVRLSRKRKGRTAVGRKVERTLQRARVRGG